MRLEFAVTGTLRRLFMNLRHALSRSTDTAGTADRAIPRAATSLQPAGPRSRFRRLAVYGALLLLLTASLSLFTAPAQAQEDCDAIWCATLTVGVDSGISTIRGFDTNSYGALSPNTFTHNSQTVTVNKLIYDGDFCDFIFDFDPGGSLRGQDYTLEFGSKTVTIPNPGNKGLIEINVPSGQRPSWSNGETVSIKLKGSNTVCSTNTTEVLSNWPLKPAGLGEGDEFRLLAKTKNPLKPGEIEDDELIANYNDHVQEQVRTRGHLSAQAYADCFRVLGSTFAVNARTNTGTTGSGGVPIYWLNGAKIADDYDDFYDGTWSNKSTGRGVAGNLIRGSSASGRQLLCTGTNDDGTTSSRPMDGATLGEDDGLECRSTSIAISSSTLGGDVLTVDEERSRYLALSNVFRVRSSTVPAIEDVSITSDAGSDKEYKVDDVIEVTVTFSEAVTVTGRPFMAFRVDAMNSEGRLVERNRRARYDADESSSTALVFSYTVRSTDFDKNGIRVRSDNLILNGGTIKNEAGDTDADLSHAEVGVQSSHRIHAPARATEVSVVSSPSVGTSYSTGETIIMQVTFDKDVRVITENGTPAFEMHFGVPYETTRHYAAFTRVVDGNKVQFDYVVQAGDSDPDGFVSMDPAIHWKRGIITLQEVDSSIALAVRAKVFETYFGPEAGHKVNAE